MALLKQETDHVITLCGTMFGHRVFCHRVIGLSDGVTFDLCCHHRDKGVGLREVGRINKQGEDRRARYDGPTNMYGPYSWPHSTRGSLAEVIEAMGFETGAFSYRGLSQGLPLGYGRR